MTITVCPVSLKGPGKCWDTQCRLRHDVVHCKPCKCFVLHGELAKHRRGEDHGRNCGFGGWKANARRPADAVLPTPYPYKRKLKPPKKTIRTRVRGKKLAGTGGVPAGGDRERHVFVSGEEGLDFKSKVGVGISRKKNITNRIPVIIQKKTANYEDVGLILVDVEVTGTGSGEFSAIASLPMKMKGNKQRTIDVSFTATAPGEWEARLVLRFLHISSGQPNVTLEITRRLHGVATSSLYTPQASQRPDGTKRTPGVRASLRHSLAVSNKNMQPGGTRQGRDTGRDSPKSY